MTTPYGAVCDTCRHPLPGNRGLTTFWHTQERFCSSACLEAKEEERRQEALRRQFQVLRGWIDAAGKCRTWKVADGTGSPIAEVTRLRDARRLVELLRN